MQNYLSAAKAFSLFGLDVYWYGIIITLGIAVAIVLGMYLTKYRKDIKAENILDAALLVIPLGIVGARLFYVLTDTATTILDFFNFRGGGLSILGGIIGGSAGLFLISIIKKLNALSLRDIIVPCVLVAQFIGRWGNFVNGEVYGQIITNPAWQWFPVAVKIGSEYHQALFFYEGMVNLIGAILLYIGLRKIKLKGVVGFAYFVWYGVWRAILEGLRMDDYQLGIDKLFSSKSVSIIIAVIGVIGIAVLYYLDWKKKNAVTVKETAPATAESADETAPLESKTEPPSGKEEE